MHIICMIMMFTTQSVVLFRQRVVVKYVSAPVCLIPAPHGNSLTDKPYIRTNPAVLEKIKQIATATRGHAGPAKIYKEAVLAASSDDIRGCPRDMKQVVQLLLLCMAVCSKAVL